MPGSIVSNIESVDDGNHLEIQPAADTEWGIQTIYHEDDVTIQFGDGADWITVDTVSGGGVYVRYLFMCTNDHYIRVTNTSGGAALIGYVGTVLRVPPPP